MERSRAVDPWDLGFSLAVKGENRLPPRHVAGRLGGQRVAQGAGDPVFQRRQGVDEFRSLEGTVAPANVDLNQYPGVNHAVDGQVGRLE